MRRGSNMRWVLVSRGEVLAGLDEHLARTADTVLRRRGVEVHTHETMEEATDEGVLLGSGERIPTRTLLWCVGVRADPLIESLDIEVDAGRVVVHETLQVPGRPEIYACGDAAAVPDPSRPGEYTAMTAQHAVRQGALAGRFPSTTSVSRTPPGNADSIPRKPITAIPVRAFYREIPNCRDRPYTKPSPSRTAARRTRYP
jgi:NADH dehydrogenase FAD-containing subunit